MPRGGKRPNAGRKPKGDDARRPLPPSIQPIRPGRPSTYDPAYCEQVVDVMRQGYSLTGFAGMIGVSRSTITAWMDVHAEFSAACTQGKAARTVHWESASIRVAERGGGPGTAQIIVFMLKNMAPDEYADTQKLEHTGKDGKALTVVIRGADADL